MRVIPAIDIIDGKCVRLTNGDYSKKKVYNENPIEIAKAFEDHGFKFLHLVDLDGAKLLKANQEELAEDFVLKNASKVMDGIDKIIKWSQKNS